MFKNMILIEEARDIIVKNSKRDMSLSQVRRLCADGSLEAQKVGGMWFIIKNSVLRYKRPKVGVKKK